MLLFTIVRYLPVAIIMPIGIPCLASILQQPPENNGSRMTSSCNTMQQRQERCFLFRLGGSSSIFEHYLSVSSSYDDANHKHNFVVANEKTPDTAASGASRRKALMMISSSSVIAAVNALAAAATTTEASTIPTDGSLSRQQLPDNDDGNAATKAPPLLLESSSLYRVQTTSSVAINAPGGPSVKKIRKEDLLNDLQSKRAVFLGEHHPESRDHRLQAALIRSLHHSIVANTPAATTTTHLAVGLEAFQGRFQPFLDEYSAGAIDGEELRTKTEWDSRWYWSFEAYRPIFEACRELGVRLLALDISTEDRLLVETGGLDAVNPETLREYVPDREGFEAFGKTPAYRSFVSYTLKPPYDLQQRRATPGKNKEGTNNSMSFSNFVARQMLRDEAMASAAWRWLSENPNGILVGCIGINHATFGCGVPGRLEQKLSKAATTAAAAATPPPSNDDPNNRRRQQQQQRMVASVLINPEPLNTGTELEICRSEGQPPIIEENDFDDRRAFFVPNNTRNQVCIENSIELQNYALQVDYVSPFDTLDEARGQTTAAATMNEAATNPQAKKCETVLGLSDYLVFSPKEPKGNRYQQQ